MKKIIISALAAIAAFGFTSCEDHTTVLFDTPFVSIVDTSGASSATVAADANGLMTELFVSVCASNNYFTDALTVEYATIIGNGLTEGVDFKIQPSTKSPLTFEKGTYSMPVRILWYKNSAFDATKDNTLKITLTASSGNFVLGVPGVDKVVKNEFIFTKK